MRSYEQALQRLALDTVDALVIHDLDTALPHRRDVRRLQEAARDSGIKALEELKADRRHQGHRHGHQHRPGARDDRARCVDLDFCLVAMPYTLLDQSSLHTGMATASKRGVSVIIGAPFASGILVTGSGSRREIRLWQGLARSAGQGPRHRGRLQGARRQPARPRRCSSCSPTRRSSRSSPARRSPSEVTQNVASLQAPIPAAFWSDLKAQRPDRSRMRRSRRDAEPMAEATSPTRR